MNRYFLFNTIFFLLQLMLQLSAAIKVNAQTSDFIYLHGEYKIKGTFIEINSKKVLYKDAQGNQESKDADDVVMIFNKAGAFIIYPVKELSKSEADDFVSAKKFPKADFIVTLERKLHAVRIITRNDHEVIYEDPGMPGKERSIHLDLVALIIYKNGSHELLVSPSQSRTILTSVAGQIREYNATHQNNESPAELSDETKTKTRQLDQYTQKNAEKSVPSQQEPKFDISAPDVPVKKEPEKTSIPVKTVSPASPVKSTDAEKIGKPDKEKKDKPTTLKDNKSSNENPTKGKNDGNPKLPAAQVKMDSAGSLTKAGQEFFNKKAVLKTEEFAALVSRIAGKNTPPEVSAEAVNQACNLFASDEARVEVSNGNDTDYKVRYKIRDFLDRVNSMKYTNVSVAWANVNYVGNLQKTVDGSYSGMIMFKEKLSFPTPMNPAYSNQSGMHTDVVIKNYKVQESSYSSPTWEVLLSDIGLVVVK